jgi:hypothetical protein
MQNGRAGKNQSARQSVEYGGEIAAASISQNSFVGCVWATAFSAQALEGKESAFASCCALLPRRGAK